MGQDLNIYEHELGLPVSFAPVFDNDVYFHRPYTDQPSLELTNLLASLGMEIGHAERFFLHPDYLTKIIPHIDGDGGPDLTKLNFVYSADPFTINWYELKPGRILPLLITDVGSEYRSAQPDDCNLIHSLTVETAEPRLINAAILHGVAQVTAPAYCFSFALVDAKNKKPLSWQQAKESFKGYLT